MNRYLIGGVPFFKSEYHPYSCTEASSKMVYAYFCKQTAKGVSQHDIEDAGARTYEGGLECIGANDCIDIGAEEFFKNLDFNTEKYEKPTFEEIKQMILEQNIPFILRMHHKKKEDGRHTVVVVGYDEKGLIVHNPDGGSNIHFTMPNKKYNVTSILVVSPRAKCNRIKPYPLKKSSKGVTREQKVERRIKEMKEKRKW